MDWHHIEQFASDLRSLGLRAAVVPGDPQSALIIANGEQAAAFWLGPDGYAGCTPAEPREVDAALSTYGQELVAPEPEAAAAFVTELKPAQRSPMAVHAAAARRRNGL